MCAADFTCIRDITLVVISLTAVPEWGRSAEPRGNGREALLNKQNPRELGDKVRVFLIYVKSLFS